MAKGIEAYLKKTSVKVDREIAKIFPKKISGKWLEFSLGKAIYAYDAETVSNSIASPIWDLLRRGGKRWRPALMLLCNEALGGSEKNALHFTVLPELVHNGCLSEDTVIWMADGTPRKITDAKEGEFVLSVGSDFRITERKIEKFHDNGEKPTLRIKTDHREIIATGEHPVLVVSKKQPVRYKITKSGKALIQQKLFEADLTISEFCDKISKEIKTDMHPKALKNSFYGYSNCLIPLRIADYVSAMFSLDKKDLFNETQCQFDKAEIIFSWKKASELRQGDFAVIAKQSFFGSPKVPELGAFEKNCKDRFRMPKEFSPELAQLCGFLVGDGCIQLNYNGGKVDFCVPKNGAGRKEYESLIEKVFGAKPYLGEGSVTMCSKAVAELFIGLGLKAKCTEKSLPNWVYSLPLEYKRAFVKGYIDADGTVTKTGITRFGCANRLLMEELKFLLDGMGFLTTNICEKRVSNEHFGERAKKKETILYCFEMGQREKVLQEIGSEIAFYKTRLGMQAQRMVQLRFRDAIPSLPESFDREHLGFEKIRKIENAGTRKTFDLQIEGTHNYVSNGIITHNTIMADDIEDCSELRRGKPCTHLVFGEDIAINASNTLYFLPLILLYRNTQKLDEKTRRMIYDVYSEEMLRVSIGQGMDIYWHRGKKKNVTEKQYLQMCSYKTGVLARFAAKLGAILAGGTQKQIEALGKFGETIGVAFQIQDDVLNLSSKKFAKGKGLGEDINEGKRSLIIIKTLERATAAEKKELLKILDSKKTSKKQINRALSIIKKYGALDYARKKAQKIVKESWKRAEKVLPESHAKKLLKEFADFLVEREI
ncbi:MAG: polyprenyl synthetase family protein [Candidatus Diapherotrites archaeon]